MEHTRYCYRMWSEPVHCALHAIAVRESHSTLAVGTMSFHLAVFSIKPLHAILLARYHLTFTFLSLSTYMSGSKSSQEG